MKWTKLLNQRRLGCPPQEISLDRSEYQKDFDRLIFSSAFRRLQGKTQVFPFPETDVIHTRLTHSLETASIGRSLGTLVGNNLEEKKGWELGPIVSVACLAHDIGNPPLGHSGEKAIAEFFNSPLGKEILYGLKTKEKADFTNFEGNAMGFHLLTYSNPKITKVTGGYGLTYPTLAAYSKYPRPAIIKNLNKKKASENKTGVFQCDIDTFRKIASLLGIPLKKKKDRWFRHPLAFLTEAADDICYSIIDFEDGYKHGLVTFNEVHDLLLEISEEKSGKSDLKGLKRIKDDRNKIGFLRSKTINSLINQIADAFLRNMKDILIGKFDQPLRNEIKSQKQLDNIYTLSQEKIYTYRPVLEVEAAGFQVLPGLLETFLTALMTPKKSSSKKILSLIPQEYIWDYKKMQYNAIMNIVLYVAGMTDKFAIDTYRNLEGIQLPNY